MQIPAQKRIHRGPRRIRTGPRAQLACVNCRDRRLKCDNHVPSCINCHRLNLSCLVEDPVTRKHQPRNYVETLEARVAILEEQLLKGRSDDSGPSTENQPREDRTVGCQQTVSPPKEDDDSASELSTRVGMLGLTMDGEEPHYLGSSSIFSFSRILHSSLRRPIPRDLVGAVAFLEEGASIPSPCPLPDYELGVTLSNAYFENIHPQYPFLHEPTFRRWEEGLAWPSQGMDALGFNPVPLFFVNMVYAVGALLLSCAGSLPQQLYLSANLYADEILSRDNLQSIQAILMYAMYSLRSSTGPSLWKLSGLALRQSIELGYHRSHKRFGGSTVDCLRLELRKRVFWCAFGIDCVATLTLGRPLGIPLREIDAEFPMDIDDSCITETGILGSPRSPSSDTPTNMSTAIQVLRLRCLWARMHGSLYSDTASRNTDDPEYISVVQDLRTELEDWLASIPPIPARANAALSIFATRDWYNLNYSETIIMLYRGALMKPQNIEGSIFQECARAAENICHGYRSQYIGKPVNYTWGTLHVIFLAGLTYLHCLWTSPVVRRGMSYDRMSSVLTDCTMLLVVLAERWKRAAPYRDLFETLAKRTTKMMAVENREQWITSDSPSNQARAESENVTRWMADISDTGISDGIGSLLNGLIADFMPHEPDTEQVG